MCMICKQICKLRVYICVCIHTHIHVHKIKEKEKKCIHVRSHAYTCKRTNTYTHTHTYTFTNTQTHAPLDEKKKGGKGLGQRISFFFGDVPLGIKKEKSDRQHAHSSEVRDWIISLKKKTILNKQKICEIKYSKNKNVGSSDVRCWILSLKKKNAKSSDGPYLRHLPAKYTNISIYICIYTYTPLD